MKWLMFFVVIFVVSCVSIAQESVRDLPNQAQPNTKFLTPGQVDSWIFTGKKGETIIAHVTTNEFDPILELATKGEKEDDRVLLEVDDKGSESRFSFRLPEAGEYKIRIHGFKFQGGGNYALQVQRFQAESIEVGKIVTGTFDREGKSHYYFDTAKHRILIPELKGTSANSWQMINNHGRAMEGWVGTLRIEEDGEHSLIVSGQPGNRYNLLIREARQRNLAEGEQLDGKLLEGEMDVWNFQGEPGQFRLLEIDAKGQVATRLIYAPLDKNAEERLDQANTRPDIQFLPVASKGGQWRFAMIAGRQGRFQLQLLARTEVTYGLKSGDPTVSIAANEEVPGNLPVGGSAFYSFQAKPGQIFHADLASDKFDSLLSLYNADGDEIEENDDGAAGLDSRITHMMTAEGLYRLQVSSRGNGGGGEFSLALHEEKLRELAVGERGQGMLHGNATDFWAFDGVEGKTVLINVRSSVCDPVVHFHDPNGVRIASDDNGGVGNDSLLAVTLPVTGRYTIWVSSARGTGEYMIRIIDGD